MKKNKQKTLTQRVKTKKDHDIDQSIIKLRDDIRESGTTDEDDLLIHVCRTYAMAYLATYLKYNEKKQE